ncbi:hypothetical protein [Clostridium beijerinckii]|uniref:hypothetical protein n=1 Tax=Clostridium beijerinckii TaxID=1520 RepID=UPI000687D23E|nr:hypothetical protein [Clostridium beijerinckii]
MKNKYLKYLKYIFIIIISLLLILGIAIKIPLLIDNYVFGSGHLSNIENKDWAGFLGSYVGAILGGIITLVGVGITINFTRAQANEDRRLSIAPYIKYTKQYYQKRDII